MQPAVGQAVARATAIISTDAAAFVQAATRGVDYLPGEVIVRFKSGASSANQTRALASLRSRPSATEVQWVGNRTARVRDTGEPDAEQAAARLRTQPEVEYAQPNYVRRIPSSRAAPRARTIRAAATPSAVPNDPSFADLQWNLRLIDAPGAWTINPGGRSDVIVAVLDTGLTTRATAIAQPLWTGQQFEQVPLRFDVTPDLPLPRVVFARDMVAGPGGDDEPFDLNGHGTHVASTIAEEANNAIALAGLAYNVRILPVKVCSGYWELMLALGAMGVGGSLPPDVGGCSDADISAGIYYAVDSGAKVINLSLGGTSPSPAVRDALLYAVSRGVFVAAAMGNTYEDGNLPEYPAADAPGIDGLMSVGAVGKSRIRAYYSSTGSHIEVVAPGGSDLDTDGREDAGYIWQVSLLPPDVDPEFTVRPRFDRYVEVGYIGTSMATAHVSAMAALLISQGVTNPRAIEAAIRRSAVDLGPIGHDEHYGHGLLQARAALFGLGAAR